jgi:hypothetical protein
MNLLWDRLSPEDFGDADGYAIQWSERQSDVQITKSVTLYQENNVDDLTLRRNSFDNDINYFARVYTYKIDANNDKVLGNGSDMYKFKMDFNNTVTSERIAITDPVVSSSTGVAQDTSDFEFGVLRRYAYDSFADFFWSQPREMTSSDFDGFMIRISESNDMNDPIIETTIDNENSSLRITGLKPDMTYYAQGYFYKEQGGEDKTFGDSVIRSFTTIISIPRDSSTRQSRNILKVENRAIRKVAISGSATSTSSSSTSTSSSTSSSSSSSSTSTSSTVSTASQSTLNNANQTEVRNKIADLKRQITSLQSELRRWESQLDTPPSSTSSNSSTTTSVSTSSTSNSSGLSIRERLKLILEAKRNQ